MLIIQVLTLLAIIGLSIAEVGPHLSVSSGAIIDLRLTYLEDAVKAIHTSHDNMLWLLVGNLAAVIASIITYIMTHRRP